MKPFSGKFGGDAVTGSIAYRPGPPQSCHGSVSLPIESDVKIGAVYQLDIDSGLKIRVRVDRVTRDQDGTTKTVIFRSFGPPLSQ